MKKHQEHIVCVKASHFYGKESDLVPYSLVAEHLMLGQRAVLEYDTDFRQVLPVTIFTCEGKVWAYRRTNTSGEKRLVGKVALAVGGHWDIEDIVLNGSVIDLEASLKTAIDRELKEEVVIGSPIASRFVQPYCICADVTAVDAVHVALITIVELETPDVKSAEDKLEDIGFVSPEELLSGDYELETWSTMIAEMLS